MALELAKALMPLVLKLVDVSRKVVTCILKVSWIGLLIYQRKQVL